MCAASVAFAGCDASVAFVAFVAFAGFVAFLGTDAFVGTVAFVASVPLFVLLVLKPPRVLRGHP